MPVAAVLMCGIEDKPGGLPTMEPRGWSEGERGEGMKEYIGDAPP